MKQSVFGGLALLLTGLAMAQQVDFATVPPRAEVQLTIYNSEDLTLVRDTRTIGLNAGVNLLQFSWANTLIDPTSVQLQFADDQGVAILDTVFPHDKAQSLTWRVESDRPRTVQSEISYFTSGISWAAEYTAIAHADETTLGLESFIRITNQSGEDYEGAQVRVVVGKINLVDKIADLARQGMGAVDAPVVEAASRSKLQRLMRAMPAAPAPSVSAMAESMAMDAAGLEPKAVEKAALGEYFLYAIEGRETIPHGWAKQLLSFRADAVPIAVVYRYRPREYGDELVKLYLTKNDTANQLGTTPLPDGQWRVFHADAAGQLRYLNSQALPYRPIGDELALNLGADPLVVFQQRKVQVTRRDVILEVQGSRVFVPAQGFGGRVDLVRRVAGWIDEVGYLEQLGNFSPRPIRVELRRAWSGDVTVTAPTNRAINTTLHDVNTTEMQFTVPANQRLPVPYRVATRQGELAKQQRVELR